MSPTMDDVARASGLSRSLVSLVFQGSPKVSEGSRARVLDAADRLGYRPNAIARSLASKQSTTLGVLLNDIANPYFAEVYASLSAAAAERGYSLLLGAGERSPERERAIIEELRDHRVAGLVLVSPRLPDSQLAKACVGLPTVVIGRTLRARGIDCVDNDEVTGARIAVEHLVASSHRAIAHISGGTGAGAAERRAAYEQAMHDAGLSKHIRVVAGDFTEEAGEAAAAELLTGRRRPTAVLAANDLVAVGLMAAAARSGVAVPADLAIVGYDNLPLSSLSMISLTTIAQPLAEFGPAAIDLVLERITDARRRSVVTTFEPRLVVRTSC